MPKMQCTILKSLLTSAENFTLEFSHTHTLLNCIMLRLCYRRATAWRCIDVCSKQRHLSVVVWRRVL